MSPFEDAHDALTFGAPVVRLYRAGLARIPDPPGWRIAVQRLRRGEGLRALAADMAASPEFLSRHGPDAPPDAFFLTALFRSAFGRDPDPLAVKSLLAPGAARADVLVAVSESDEAKRTVSFTDALFPDGLPPDDRLAYQLWLHQHRREEADEHLGMERLLESLPNKPLVSLLIPVQPIRPDLLLETLAALERQLWPAWEALLLCPSDLPPHARDAAAGAAARTPGVRLVAAARAAEGGSAPSAPVPADLANAGLREAHGELCGLLDPGDVLAGSALLELAAEFAAPGPEAVLAYADEDQVDGAGRRTAPTFKGDWSWDLALAGDAAGQPALYRTRHVLERGGLRAEAAPFERYDLLLRATRDTPPGAVRHVPRILLHRGRGRRAQPAPFPNCTTATEPVMRRIAEAALAAAGSPLRLGTTERASGMWPAVTAAVTVGTAHPLVSVIIPIRDRPELLETCAAGVLDQTRYPAVELVVADNGSVEPRTRQLLRRLERDGRVRVLDLAGPFNWSALNNAAAREAKGEVLLLLNNDVQVVEPGWLDPLVAHAMRPEVGAIGARLLYPGPEQRLQHGGIALGKEGSAVHLLHYALPERAGYRGALALTRPAAAVTGACLATRKAVFQEVGGFDERLRVAWNDIDYCLRVRSRGMLVLWTPDATLLHVEFATRGRDLDPGQVARHEGEHSVFLRTWRDAASHDPFLNPNLRATEDGNIVFGVPAKPRLDAAPAGPGGSARASGREALDE